MKKEGNHKKLLEERILEHSSNYSVPAKKSKEFIWKELSKQINKPSKKKRINSFMYKAAAVAVILITSSLFFWLQDTTIKTNFAQQKEIILPDGSSVIMQAGSSISFNKQNWKKNRLVKLNGEAFFSVKKGSKFSVQTSNGTVQVLGTKFNVISRDNHYEVVCITGKVRVKLQNTKQEQILTKGLYTKKENNKLLKPDNINIELILNRQKGKFAFNKSKLSDVFAEIERQFDVEIQYKGDNNRLFTGFFSNKDIDKALRMVCVPMNLNYQKNKKTILINELDKPNN